MAADGASAKIAKHFATGTVLFCQGEPGRDMYVVQSGMVRISVTVRGVEKVLVDLGAGEFFGEMSILTGAPRSATAIVVQEAELLVIAPETFESMLRKQSEIGLRMIKKLAARLQAADEQIGNLLLRDHSSRVAQAILNVAKRVSPDAQGGISVVVDAHALAGQTGLDRSEVEKVLQRLQTAGLINWADGALHLAKLEPLVDYLGVLEMNEKMTAG